MIPILLAIAIIPRCEPVTDQVHGIVLEHVHDNHAKRTFVQLIYYAANGDVIDWRIQRDPAMIPQRHGDYWQAEWWDKETYRRVRAKSFCEVWVQTDSELEARQILPSSERRLLSP